MITCPQCGPIYHAAALLAHRQTGCAAYLPGWPRMSLNPADHPRPATRPATHPLPGWQRATFRRCGGVWVVQAALGLVGETDVHRRDGTRVRVRLGTAVREHRAAGYAFYRFTEKRRTEVNRRSLKPDPQE